MGADEIQRTVEKDVVCWDYRGLAVLGVEGRLQKPLGRIRELYGNGPLEMGDVKEEPYRHFLAGFHLDPPVDVTVIRTPQEDSSIVTYSMGTAKGRARELIDALVRSSGFRPRPPGREFIRQIEDDLLVNAHTYDGCAQISGIFTTEIEKVFGVVHYSNFLSRYKGVPLEESFRRANEKYGLLK